MNEKKESVLTWLLTVLSIIGVIANTHKKRWCFLVWTVTNFSWMCVDLHHEIYPQAALFFVYFMLSIYGWFKWE